MITRINKMLKREMTGFEEARNTQTKADALIVLDHLVRIANAYVEYELNSKKLNKE